MRLAKDLGLTLTELRSKMTIEEVCLWSVFYELDIEESEKQAKRKR
jgi:hypothetical protein